MTRYITLVLLAPVLAPPLCAQDKPLFPGAEFLDSCLVELPLTYAKKDQERYMQAARYLDNEELIHLTYNKQSGTASYARVYVVVETAKDGTDLVYIETTEDHLRMGGAKQAYFPKFRPSTQRFYNADCFDRQVAAHSDLERILRKGEPPKE
jgi:hypothetical protein